MKLDPFVKHLNKQLLPLDCVLYSFHYIKCSPKCETVNIWNWWVDAWMDGRVGGRMVGGRDERTVGRRDEPTGFIAHGQLW